MRSVSTILQPKHSLLILLLFGSIKAFNQENSPFSRYGLGEAVPAQNIVNRALGGVSAAYKDGQSINFTNPASFSSLNRVTYDLGLTLDSRNLKSANPLSKYNSVNLIPSYVTLGLPINKKRHIGLAFGLKPVTRINYSILESKKLPRIDSVQDLYSGEGGINEVFVGLGKSWGGFSIGINGGYMFGRKQTGTVVSLSDTLFNIYNKSNSTTTTTFGSGYLSGGVQYDISLSKTSLLRLGASGNLKHSLNAKQDITRETFDYTGTGTTSAIDSVFSSVGKKGTIDMPATFTAGAIFQSFVTNKLGARADKASFGVEYTSSKWADYRFYNQADKLINSTIFRVGGEITPNPLGTTNFWSHVAYRAGFYKGKDYINADGKELPMYAFTAGLGLPIRNWRPYSDYQFTIINVALEAGKRGNKDNNITEGFFRLSLGLSLSDIWFIKRRYD